MKFSLARAATLVLVLAFTTFGSACRSTRGGAQVSPPVPVQSTSARDTIPDWIEEPLSPEKLQHIEQWLAGEDPLERGYWQVEGDLQLALGRIELARRESARDATAAKSTSAKGTPSTSATPTKDPLLAARLRSSRATLEKLSVAVEANDSQRKRAADGLARADRMLGSLGQPALTLGVDVVSRSSWGALPARAKLMTKNQGGWKRITVHHSAEADPTPLDGSEKASAAALRQIQRSHLSSKQPPWGDIGYHFLIDPQGRVFQGRELAWQGAHAKGDNNVQNIGICLLGNFDEERPAPEALESLRKLLDNLRRIYAIPRSQVHPHSDFRSTDCPGKLLKPWVTSYAKGTSALSNKP